MRWYKSALLKALEASDGERLIHAFLKRNPQLVVTAFNWGWNKVLLVPEFRLGTRLRADFVLFGAYSGGWRVQFIELEPVGARLYLQDGTPSKPLRKAVTQISDWRDYIGEHGASLREQLSHAMVSRNVYVVRNNPTSRYLEKEIRDKKVFIDWDFQIVISRRERLSPEDDRRRSRDDFHNLDIATYDRIVEAAEKLDHASREILQGRREYARRTQ